MDYNVWLDVFKEQERIKEPLLSIVETSTVDLPVVLKLIPDSAKGIRTSKETFRASVDKKVPEK